MTTAKRASYEWEQRLRLLDAGETGRYCRACELSKPLADFGFHPSNRDGVQHVCKACQAENARRKRAGLPSIAAERGPRHKDHIPATPGIKKCARCRRYFDADRFPSSRISRDGLQSFCRYCYRELARLYRQRKRAWWYRSIAAERSWYRLTQDADFAETKARSRARAWPDRVVASLSKALAIEAAWHLRHTRLAGRCPWCSALSDDLRPYPPRPTLRVCPTCLLDLQSRDAAAAIARTHHNTRKRKIHKAIDTPVTIRYSVFSR
jgi:hypothetical protein